MLGAIASLDVTDQALGAAWMIETYEKEGPQSVMDEVEVVRDEKDIIVTRPKVAPQPATTYPILRYSWNRERGAISDVVLGAAEKHAIMAAGQAVALNRITAVGPLVDLNSEDSLLAAIPLLCGNGSVSSDTGPSSGCRGAIVVAIPISLAEISRSRRGVCW